MRISHIDHLVITTVCLEKCLEFYVGLLGMEHRTDNGHHNLFFPGGKSACISKIFHYYCVTLQ